MHPTMMQLLAEARIQDLSRDAHRGAEATSNRRHRSLHRRGRGQH